MDALVVARYNEDVSWVCNFPSMNHTIYNKGNPDLNMEGVVPLPNIGRESHTYLHHIVQSYDTLDPSNVTFFTQGGLKDHNISHPLVLEMIEEARQKGFSDSAAQVHKMFDIHIPKPTFRIKEYPKGKMVTPNAANESFGAWFQRCVMPFMPYHKAFRWTLGAIFAVRNDRILAKPKSYYEMLLIELGTDINPEVGHFFERAWFYIFSPQPSYVLELPHDIPATLPKVLLLQIDNREVNYPHAPKIPEFPSHDGRTTSQVKADFESKHKALSNFPRNFERPHFAWSPDYYVLTHIFNKTQVKKSPHWSYEYVHVSSLQDRHPSWTKYHTVLGRWDQLASYDIIIVMDTDAWIRDMGAFDAWIRCFHDMHQAHFMYAGEPNADESFHLMNTPQVVNGGLTIFKPTAYVKETLQTIFQMPECQKEYARFKKDWSYEQICINRQLYDNPTFRQSVMVAPMDHFNTPSGKIVAHCWWKEYVAPMILPELLACLLKT
jgi:hypothetical protein